MIDELSVVYPLEEDRVPLFIETLGTYLKQGILFPIEFVIVSRTIEELVIPGVDINLINYEWEGEHFNPAMALNLGVKNSKYKNIMVTCPEVKPISNVLEQLSSQVRGNYMCQVWDQKSDGSRAHSLVNSGFRSKTPSMYFMAVFKKEDIEAINGWNNKFMGLYGYEDDNFGDRFVRAELKFSVKDGIVGEHQYHKRGVICDAYRKARELFEEDKRRGVIKPKDGLYKLEEDVCLL